MTGLFWTWGVLLTLKAIKRHPALTLTTMSSATKPFMPLFC
jgi:hypothetical protein